MQKKWLNGFRNMTTSGCVLATLILGCGLFSMQVFGQEISVSPDKLKESGGGTMDLPSYLASLQSIQEVTVSLAPSSWFFYGRLDENTLRKLGCSYSTRDPSLIAHFQDVLKKNEVKASVNNESQFDVRNGIFLTLTDGTIVKILFGQKFSGLNTVQGTFNHSSANVDTSITAIDSLPKDLIQWALETGAPSAKNFDTKLNCLRTIHR
ncbi:hypothetical protein [Collimonas pratensis]|uniref:hypothetical protein n=1 Tax=Collimonas pratensis TaxID=279113 RepID=UPI000ABDEB54|nr:hypothetical protein [Collimonas pratensis]